MRTRIVIECSAPTWAIPGIKEDLAMHLERYGDCSVIEVAAIDPEPTDRPQQAKIRGFEDHSRRSAATK